MRSVMRDVPTFEELADYQLFSLKKRKSLCYLIQRWIIIVAYKSSKQLPSKYQRNISWKIMHYENNEDMNIC